MMRPRPWPSTNTGSLRCTAYTSSAMPPMMLRIQKLGGTTTARARSEAIHCQMKREPNANCPANPTTSHACEMVNQLDMNDLLGAGANEPRLEPARAPQIGKAGPQAIQDAVLG